MEQDVLNILDFDQIRSKLVELAPSTMAKIMASELTPSSMPEIIDQNLRKRKRQSYCFKEKCLLHWEKHMI